MKIIRQGLGADEDDVVLFDDATERRGLIVIEIADMRFRISEGEYYGRPYMDLNMVRKGGVDQIEIMTRSSNSIYVLGSVASKGKP